jgi:ketosteroid isomerase-like protein
MSNYRTLSYGFRGRAHSRGIWSFITACILLVGGLRAATAQTSAKPPAQWNPQERAAVELVKEWIAAWNAKDAKQIAALVAEDCVFRPDPSDAWQQGRDKLYEHAVKSGLMRASKNIEITEIFPVGGSGDTFVLTKRIDYLDRVLGGSNAVPVAAFFRVKNGKIEEWLDEPIVQLRMPARRQGQPPNRAP